MHAPARLSWLPTHQPAAMPVDDMAVSAPSSVRHKGSGCIRRCGRARPRCLCWQLVVVTVARTAMLTDLCKEFLPWHPAQQGSDTRAVQQAAGRSLDGWCGRAWPSAVQLMLLSPTSIGSICNLQGCKAIGTSIVYCLESPSFQTLVTQLNMIRCTTRSL